MRKLALLLSLSLLPFLTSCNLTWEGQGAGLTEDQRERNIKDVARLAAAYDTETYYRRLRQRGNGRSSAFGRDLGKIQGSIDRHFFNYSRNDPYLDHDSDLSIGDHTMRFLLSSVVR